MHSIQYIGRLAKIIISILKGILKIFPTSVGRRKDLILINVTRNNEKKASCNNGLNVMLLGWPDSISCAISSRRDRSKVFELRKLWTDPIFSRDRMRLVCVGTPRGEGWVCSAHEQRVICPVIYDASDAGGTTGAFFSNPKWKDFGGNSFFSCKFHQKLLSFMKSFLIQLFTLSQKKNVDFNLKFSFFFMIPYCGLGKMYS